MRLTTPFEQKFPKFVIADSADDRTFVIHLHHPRFVGEVTGHYLAAVKIEPEFIDDASDLSAEEMAALMRQAGDFYQEETSRE
jgi:hypothetical protein